MTNSRIEYLIQRYLNDTLLPSEQEELTELLASKENETIAREFFSKAWEKSKSLDPVFSPRKSKEILQNIVNNAKAEEAVHLNSRGNRTGSPLLKRIAVAATLLIGFGLGINYYISYHNSHNTETNGIAQKIKQPQDISPGGNRAVLTLADNTQINLDEIKNGSLARVGNIIVKKTQDGQIIYEVANDIIDNNTADHKDGGFNSISTPRGGQYKVILADGSKVWLNSASTLKFPTKFSAAERLVELSGEGYFEVAKDRERRFRVKSASAEVEVLGTHFNVSAYPDEAITRTTLLEGSVKVSDHNKSLLIKPGQQARITKGAPGIALSEVDTDEAVAWKDGYFVFSDTDIHTIMRHLSRWYDVDVEFKDPDIHETFAGRVSKDKNISEVLKVFEATGTIQFEIIPGDAAGKGRRVIVMK